MAGGLGGWKGGQKRVGKGGLRRERGDGKWRLVEAGVSSFSFTPDHIKCPRGVKAQGLFR